MAGAPPRPRWTRPPLLRAWPRLLDSWSVIPMGYAQGTHAWDGILHLSTPIAPNNGGRGRQALVVNFWWWHNRPLLQDCARQWFPLLINNIWYQKSVCRTHFLLAPIAVSAVFKDLMFYDFRMGRNRRQDWSDLAVRKQGQGIVFSSGTLAHVFFFVSRLLNNFIIYLVYFRTKIYR